MKKLFGLAVLALIVIFPVFSWARGGGGCLEKGTPVLTPEGSTSIETLNTGDRVWAVTGGKLKEARVRAVIKVQPEKYLEISAAGTRLRITPEHPVMTAPGEYVLAGQLVPGDKIFLTGKDKLTATPIQSINNLPAKRPAYNLLVSPGGTFIAGNFVLHNKGCFLPDSPILMADGWEIMINAVKPGDMLWSFKPDGHLVKTRVRSVIKHEVDDYIVMKTDRAAIRVTEEHPFYVGRGKFKTVEALKKGDTIFAFDGKWLAEQKILSMEKVHQRVQVYNLQTDLPNTFFAHGLAVHNKGGGCFPAGTSISTPQGEKAIEQLAAGDEILAVDEQGHTVRTRVKTIFINKNPLVQVETPEGNFLATGDHPISIGQGRFRRVCDLNAGTPIIRWENGRLIEQKIGGINHPAGKNLVFNLEVNEPHTFIAGGIVVHNKGGGCLPAGTPITTLHGSTPIEKLNPGNMILSFDPEGKVVSSRVLKIFKTRALVLDMETDAGALRTTADHPVGCPGGEFIPAGQLKAGQKVLVWKEGALQPATVLRINWKERELPLYNLGVEWPNTFLAAGFLTHNKGGGGFSHSGSSHSGGGSYDSPFISFIKVIIFFLLMIVIVGLLGLTAKKSKEENLDFVYPRNRIIPKAEKTEKLLAFLSQQDQSMKPEELRKLVSSTFIKLQECWGKRDYGPMSTLLMPNLFAQHTAQLQGLMRNHEINRLDDLRIEKIDLVNVRYTEKTNQREFTALITASARDYYQDDRTGEFLRGDQKPARFQEFWTLQMMDKGWLLREIEQAGESDVLKDDNFAEMLTDDTVKGIYGVKAAPQGTAGPWLEKDVEQKANRIDRMLNFLSQTDKLWDRNKMLEGARRIFLNVYLARESGEPGGVPAADLFPAVSENLRTQLAKWKEIGHSCEYRNLCVRKVELLLVRNYADNTQDEYTVRISAHAQQIIRRSEQVISRESYVTPFEEYWTFGRLDGQWKLKEILPPAQGQKAVTMENIDEDSTPDQLKWYYRQPRAK
jgi:predicted lipid-binding transport protein (Tim44 family)